MPVFTDVEIGLMMRHKREMNGLAGDAQRIIDRQHVQLQNLRFALEAQRAINGDLKADVGRSRIDDILAIRALKKRATAH